MTLEMRRQCERCQAALPADGLSFICSHECSFCESCAANLTYTCPNCGGELVRRPRRLLPGGPSPEPAATGDSPASTVSWKLVVGIWTAYGLLASLQQDVSALLNGRSIEPWTGLVMQLPQAWYWAALTPVVIRLGRRLPLRGPGWPLRVIAHLLIGAAIVFVLDILFALYAPLVAPAYVSSSTTLVRASRLFGWSFLADSMLYWGLLGVGYVVDEAARSRGREVQQSKLQGQLATARLAALKMQLHPHFLFNALHTVGALVRTGRSAPAIQVVARLGDLLRRMLDGAMTQEVPLGEEVEFIRAYLEVEQIRFEDRLVVQWNIQPGVLDAKVPHLILQPLVENALRHGLGSNEAAGHLTIEARRTGESLELAVSDEGPGLDGRERAEAMRGVGLANTQLRLSQLYGKAASLEVANAPPPAGGVIARIRVPFELMAADWEGGKSSVTQ
jgi:two-component system, LytTR family, sensor kinase